MKILNRLSYILFRLLHPTWRPPLVIDELYLWLDKRDPEGKMRNSLQELHRKYVWKEKEEDEII